MDWEGDQKEEEEPIIAPANAIIHPGTVMIERLQAKLSWFCNKMRQQRQLQQMQFKLTSMQWLHTEQWEQRGGR